MLLPTNRTKARITVNIEHFRFLKDKHWTLKLKSANCCETRSGLTTDILFEQIIQDQVDNIHSLP